MIKKDLYECFVKQFHYPEDYYIRRNTLKQYLEKDIPEDSIIFIDNLDVTESEDEFIQFLVKIKCTVICSSRINDFESFQIDFLDKYQSMLMFKKYYDLERKEKNYTEKENKTIELILERTGYHTLAIETIAKIGKADKRSLFDLFEELNRVGFNLSGFAKVQFSEKTLIGHLCRIFKVAKLTKTQKHILGSMSLYPNNQIPKEFLLWLNVQNNINIRYLIRHAWFTEDVISSSFYMHPIIKEVVSRLCAIKYEDSKSIISSIYHKIAYKANKSVIERRKWLGYSENIVKRFENNFFQDIALLQYNISVIYWELGDNKKALKYINPSIKTFFQISSYELLAHAYMMKGSIYYNKKKDKRAYVFYMKAYLLKDEIEKRTYAETCHCLAQCLQGIYESEFITSSKSKASRLYLKALNFQLESNKIFEKMFKGNELHLASAYNNTGYLYSLSDDRCNTMFYYRKALYLREKQLSKNAPELSISYYRIGAYFLDSAQKEQKAIPNKKLRIKLALYNLQLCYDIRVHNIKQGNDSMKIDHIVKLMDECRNELSMFS